MSSHGSYNKLIIYLKEFGDLYRIYDLNIGRNKFKTVPASLCQLQNIVLLDLHDNAIEYVPPEFTNLIQLWDLRMQVNMCYATLRFRLKTLTISRCTQNNSMLNNQFGPKWSTYFSLTSGYSFQYIKIE